MQQAQSRRLWVVPVLAAALLGLTGGLWAGLVRIGWRLPVPEPGLAAQHGGLMVAAFVATLVTLERALASGRSRWLGVPALSGAAGIAMLAGLPAATAPLLATASGVGYALLLVSLMRQRHASMPMVLMLVGAGCLAVAGLRWLLAGQQPAVSWWMAFLVLTITAERLEILRFVRFSSGARAIGACALVTVIVGAAVSVASREAGNRLEGAGLVMAALWLLRNDHARRTVRTEGLARFSATGVLGAYGWLLVSGLFMMRFGLPGGGLSYDAAVHGFFVGFVFGSIEAHEPIMAPALSGLAIPFSRLLYVPLGLLHASLVVRVGADLVGNASARQWAGILQVGALLTFLGVSLFLVVSGLRTRRTASTG